MDSKLKSLYAFLSDNELGRINIPIYQRSYDWKAHHVDQFLNDIEYHINNSDESSYQFLGMIVYVIKQGSSDEYKEIEIIDGQQRLTTFYLLASIVFDWIKYQWSTDHRPNKLEKSMLEKLYTQSEKIRDMLYTADSIENLDLPTFEEYKEGSKSNVFFKTKLYTDNTYKEDKAMTEFLLMHLREAEYMIKLDDESFTENSNPLTTRKRMFNPVKGGKPIIKDLNVNTSKSRPIVKNHLRIQTWFKNKYF